MSIGFDADNIFILFITIPCIIICVKKIKFVKNECFATKGVCISYDGSAGVTKLLSYNGTYKYFIDGKEYVSSTKNYQEMNVRRHITGGENCTLISAETPPRLCRTGN